MHLVRTTYNFRLVVKIYIIIDDLPNNKFGLLYAYEIFKQTLDLSTQEKGRPYWTSLKANRESIPHRVHNVSKLFIQL